MAIENIDVALLAGGDEFIGMGAVLIGEDNGPGGTQVKIVGVEVSHAPRGEIIGDRKIGGKLDDAIAVGLATVWDIEPIAAGFGGLHEDVAVFVGGETGAGLPDGSQSVVGRGVEDSALRQTGSVVGKDPAAVAIVAEVRAEAQVKDTVEQQEAGAVFLVETVEDGFVPLIAGAGGGDQDGAARLLIAGGDIEGVEMVTDGRVEKRLGHQIHGVGGGIDNWSSGNAFLGETGTGAAREIFATGSRATVKHAGVPELGAGIGVNRVDRIHLGDDVDDVVRALPVDVHVGHVEGLGHHDIVDGKAEEAAEGVLIDVGGSEQSFISVGAVAGVITAAGCQGLLREGRRQKTNADDE